MRRLALHAAAFVAFAAVTAVWLWPLWTALSGAVPGAGAGDNLTFVWDGWWMRRALTTGAWPLWTPAIFAPWGVDLTLHTHTALPAAAAALLSSRMSIVAATNLVVTAHLFLNFACAYALAWRLTHRTTAAVVAALIFGWSPYIAAHLAGHFNLIAAWILPLVALGTIDALERPGHLRALALGAALGITVFIDYYYAVYAAILVVVLSLARSVTITRHTTDRARWQRASLRAIAVLAAIVVLILVIVATTGGGVVALGGVRVSVRGTGNLVAALGLLALLAGAIAWLPSVRVRVAREQLASDARRLAVPIAVALAIASPILASLVRLWMAGDYVSQHYFWRSAPRGIDLSTLVLGNPGGLLWGGIPSAAYARLGVDRFEQAGWLGPGTIALAAFALILRRGDRALRAWVVAGIIFFVWALGPYLVAFGQDLRVLLPATLVRFVPVLSNARIPARAIVVVYLVLAVLAAHGFTALRDRGRGQLAALLFVLVVLDGFPAPIRVFAIARPAVYDALAARMEPGAVCELPLGIRDGFDERGRANSGVLLYQTIHERAIAGGFVARLPPRLAASYESHPVLGPLLRLSEGRPLAAEHVLDPDRATAALLADGFRFIVVDVGAAPPDLLEYVRTGLHLKLLASDGGRELYELALIAG